MRVSATKTAPRVERNVYNLTRKIKYYGKNNDYPQKVLQIIGSSGTGKNCVDIYSKFIVGNGFVDEKLSESFLNPKERANGILKKCGQDLRRFNGFALLVKYNGSLQQEEIYNIPFEHCRLEIDGNKKLTGKIAVHPDWTQESGLQFKPEEIKYINAFNPETVRQEMTDAGGPEYYLGQVYYFTASGDMDYPTCPIDPVVTDMLTEESVSTIKHRNAKYNFLPSGMLVRKGIRPNTVSDTDDPQKDENEETRQEILRMQGDENTAKIWVIDIDTDEEKPEFTAFEGKNFDKQFDYTEKSVKLNIGEISMIPPILRGIDVGAGFGADKMRESYDFMNSVVDEERRSLQVVFLDILTYSSIPFTTTDILPLEYKSSYKNIQPELLTDLTGNERRALAGYQELPNVEAKESVLAVSLGVGGTQALTAIVTDPNLLPEQKVQLLIKVFAFEEADARLIIGK